jgi:hypothetical protein
MGKRMLDALIARGFEIEFLSHALSILSVDFPAALAEIEAVLADTSVSVREIVGSGGGEAAGTQRMRRAFAARGWVKKNFIIRKTVDGAERESTSHQIDHVKTFENGTLALEIEWNNKDPFFDRDLENFKRLHGEGAISVGIMVTRGASLQNALRPAVLRFATDHQIGTFDDLAALRITRTARQREEIETRVRNGRTFADAWASHFVSDKFGESTTHWRKLQDRVRRGVGNPCPLLLIGLSDRALTAE